MAETTNDTFSKAGAWALAVRVHAFWAGLGYAVTVWVEEAATRKLDGKCWCVRSDLMNGMPRSGGR